MITNKEVGANLQSLPKYRGGVFSFYRAPITNTKPHKTVNLLQIYNAIVGNFYKERTEKLRTIFNSQPFGKDNSPLPFGKGSGVRCYKASNFDYCTFSGTFTTRADRALIAHSGLICLDFDNLNRVETLFEKLLTDQYFETQLLFRSPSGNGLKWIIPIDINCRGVLHTPELHLSHRDFFIAVSNYIFQTYGIEVDKSGKDLSRACFLPHDPHAYINPVLLKH